MNQHELKPLTHLDRRERHALAAGHRLVGAAPGDTIRWAFAEFRGRVAIGTGFGAEGVALIDMAAKVAVKPDVFFLDTGFLFAETYALRRRIEKRYGLRIRAVRPDLSPESQRRIHGPELWARDPDLCCSLRKLQPLTQALGELDAWMTAIRRDQTSQRAGAREVEWDARWQLVKINPLARWTGRDVWNYIVANDVPYNPLHDRSYPSVGCTHCTTAVAPGESERAGRWRGRAKTECGLHADAARVRESPYLEQARDEQGDLEPAA